jgi:cytochrome c oxidase assembly factor CtaG
VLRRDPIRRATQVAALLVTGASSAHAHDGRPLAPHDLWSAWERNPLILLALLLAAVVYAGGTHRLWRRSAVGRGIGHAHAAAFAAGWLALVVALVSPLHALGSVLFSAHMTQHEVMMVVAAPLLVLGRPHLAAAWALTPAWRRSVGRWMRRPALRRAWRLSTDVSVAWWGHAAALALWHLPGPYNATITSATLHALQHASFLVTALLFWWAVLHPARSRRAPGVFYLFVATLVTGAIGALLAFAPNLWYEAYVATTGRWGLTPLVDQQLGGIIMWIPGGASYLVAALTLVAVWLREPGRRARRATGPASASDAKRWSTV